MKRDDIKLIKVDGNANNNKFYNMIDNGDNTFTAHYGRVGTNGTKKTYHISKWGSTYRTKTSSTKGYKDITTLTGGSTKTVVDYVKLADKTTQDVLDFLLERNKHQIGLNYRVKAVDVKAAQVDEAQNILDDITNKFTSKKATKDFVNQRLTDLYNTLPRKMKKVSDYLLSGGLSDKSNRKWLQTHLAKEQDLLDNFRTQVGIVQINTSNNNQQMTMLDALGIKMERVTDNKVINRVKSFMDKHGLTHGRSSKWSNILINVWEVDNPKDSKAFDDNSAILESNNKSNIVWGWHGSRNENWLSILKSGLKIRPSGAVHTGSMFGDGIYSSDNFGKSMNYTSSTHKGHSYGAGNDGSAFLAILEVEKGKQYVCKQHTSDCYSYSYRKLQKMGGYHSCWAPGGIYHSRGGKLQNSELIVYKNEQVKIKYLIQVR